MGVNSLKEDMRQMIEESNAEINERLGKIEKLLNQLVYPNTTPSIALINSTISNPQKQFQSQKNVQTPDASRRSACKRRKSRSMSKCSYPYDLIPEIDEIKALSAKELRRKDSQFDGTLCTLHFLYKHKKVAILPFTPETTIGTVKEKLNSELETKYSYTIDKLQLLSKRISEGDDSQESKWEDKDTLQELKLQGHQLIYCYGVNKQEQKRARTMTSSTTKLIQPRVIVSDAPDPSLPPASLDIFVGRKKKSKATNTSSSMLNTDNSKKLPNVGKRKIIKHTSSPDRLHISPDSTDDELSNLQKMIREGGSDISFEEYPINSPQIQRLKESG